MRTLIFDTETTGKADFKRPNDLKAQPYIVQLAALLVDDNEDRLELSLIVNPGVPIPAEVAKIHGIDSAVAERYGVKTIVAVAMFDQMLALADRIAGHNIDFDLIVMRAAFDRVKRNPARLRRDALPRVCTMKSATDLLKLPGNYGFKFPKLIEAHEFLFGHGFESAHDALADVRATARVLAELEKREIELKGGSQ